MRKEIKDLLEKADAFKREAAQSLKEARQCLFELWELILEDDGLAPID